MAKKVLSLVVLFFFLVQEVGRTQTGSQSYTPFNPSSVIEDATFIDQEQFEAYEARQLYLKEQAQQLQQMQLEFADQNLQLIEQYNQQIKGVMEVQRLNEQQVAQEIEGAAEKIQKHLGSVGENYVLFDDGKKVTFKAGRTIAIENETVTDKLGNKSTRNTLGMQYNEAGQLVSYDQSTVNALGQQTRVEWREGSYWSGADQNVDARRVTGKLSGYVETIYEPTGQVSTRTWDSLHYYTEADQQADPTQITGQLASYRAETVGNDAPAATQVTEFSQAHYEKRAATPTATDPSDDEEDILLTSFHEKSTVLGVTTERDFFNAQYNEHEQLVSYDEESETLGVETSKQWRNGTYDDLGRLTSFNETTETDGVVTHRRFENARYNDLDQLISYTDSTETNGLSRETEFRDATYDELGRLSSFTNEITENGLSYTQHRSEIEYNDEGLATSYLDVVDRQGVVTETRRANATYDAFGRLMSYEDQVREVGAGDERSYRVVREVTFYNAKDEVIRYKETIYFANGLVQSIDRGNISYNDDGLVVEFFETVHESGNVQKQVSFLDENGSLRTRLETVPIDRSYTRLYRNAKYDFLKRVMSYEEEIVDLARPDVKTTRKRSEMTYDAQNRVSSFKEVETVAGPLGTAEVTEREKRDIVYDSLGRELSYFERVVDPTGSVVERFFEDAVYDAADNLVSYQERITVNGETITRIREQVVRDGLGRVVSFIETEFDLFGVKTIRERLSTQYNTVDEELDFEERVTRIGSGSNPASQAVALETRENVKRFDVVRDSSGKLLSYKEERADALGGKTEFEFKEATYDAAGKLTAKTEVIHRIGFDSGSASMKELDILFTRRTQNIAYNDKGRELSFEEILTYQDGLRDFSQTTAKENLSYNDAGLLIAFKETFTSSAELGKTLVRERLSTTYNDKNVVSASEELTTETGVDAAGNTVLQRQTRSTKSGVVYDAVGQEFAFTEVTAFEGGSVLSVTTERLASNYNSLGQLIGSSEKIIRSDAPDLTVEKNLSAVTYNSFGFRETFQETTSEVGGGISTQLLKKRLTTTYNKIGLETSFTEETQGLDAQTQAVLWSEMLVKENVTLDLFGRETGFEERFTDRLGIERSRTRSAVAYNSLGQQTGYQELRRYFDFSETETRSQITYDLQGRLNSFTSTLNLVGSDAATGISLEQQRTVTRETTQYNNQDQVIATKEKEINSEAPELEVGVERSGVTYNAVGLLQGYTDTLVQKSVVGASQPRETTVVVVREGMQYTVNKELLAYVESIRRSVAPNEVETVTFDQTSYDLLGRLTGFREKRQSNLLTESVTRTRSNMVYDSRNRLVTFVETALREGTLDNEAFAATQTRMRTQTTYNALDQVTAFTENVDSSDEPKKMRVEYSGGNYNRAGQLLSFKQERFLEDGRLFDSVTRLSTEYNALGDVTRSVQTERSITEPDIETQTELNGILFDLLGRQIGFTQILRQLSTVPGPVSQLDVTSTRQRSDIAFNDDGRVVSYKEKTTTSSESELTTETTVSGITYNALGAQSAFVQTILRQDSVGNLAVNSRLERSQIRTNYLGEVQSYQELFQADGQENVTTTRSNVVANDFGQVVSYDEEGVSVGGETYRLSRSGITYNGFGLVQGYEESGVRSSEGGYQVRRLETGYNGLGQAVQYKEERTVAEETTRVERQSSLYNGLSQLLSYNETRTDLDFPDLVQTVAFSQAGYDVVGRLTTFVQSLSTTGSTFVETTERTQTEFDAQGVVTGFTEEKTRSGFDASGVALSVNETVRREKMVYHPSGLIASFEETVTNPLYAAERKRVFENAQYTAQAQLVSFEEKLFEGGMLLSQRTRETTLLDAAGKVIGFTEKEISGDALDLEVTTTVSEILYNAQGLQTSFKQNQIFKNKLTQTEQAATAERAQITYDSFGRLTGYQETGVGIDGVSFSSRRFQIEYDLNSRLVGYSEETTRQTGEEVLLTRSGIETNLRGEVTAYQDRVVQSAQPDVEMIQQASQIETNSFGRQTAVTLQTERRSKISGELLSTLNMTRSEIVTNSLAQVVSYREQSSGSQQAEIDLRRTEIVYNEKGEALSFKEAGTNSQSGAFSLERKNFLYDALSRVVSYEEAGASGSTGPYTLNRRNITYNALGQETGYLEEGETTQGPFSRNRSNIFYNTLGLITGYQETQTSAQAPDETITVTFRDAVYNSAGQLISFVQERLFAARGLTETVARQSTQYNADGKVIGFTEAIERAGESETITRSNIAYNDKDLIISYEELRQTQGVAEARKILFANAVYDGEARLLQFEQETRLASDNALLEKRTRTQTNYDDKSQVTGFAETILSGAQPDLTTTQTTSNIVYDAAGRQVSYEQTFHTQSSATGALDATTTLSRTAITYDGLGQITGYQETSSSPDGAITRTRSNITRNLLGQETGFTEALLNNQGAEQIVRSAITYNLLGEVVSYNEEKTLPEAPENRTSLFFHDALYNRFGQLLSFIEERSSSASLIQEMRTRTTTAYNSFGQVSGYAETLGQRGVDANGNQIDLTQQIARSHITYNSLGQLLSYEEELDSGDLKQRRFFSDTVYDAAARLVQFKEKLYDRESGTLLGETERLETIYDTNGLVLETRDKSISGAAPDVEVTARLSAISYDAAGRQTGFTREVTSRGVDAAGNVVLEVSSTQVRSAIAYNSFGQAVGYHDLFSGGEQPTVDVTRTEISYNGLGQLVSYREEGDHQVNGHFVTVQRNRQYNSEGELLSFEEETNSQGQGNLIHRRSEITTNLFGQETAYKEEQYLKEGENLTLSLTVERVAIAYNSFGQLVGYVEDSVSPAAPDNTLHTVLSEASYDTRNRLNGFKREATSSASQIVQTVLRTQSNYDLLSQLIGFEESRTQTGTLAGGQQLNILQQVSRAQSTYNGVGQLLSYKETISDNTVSYARVVEFSGAIYDSQARLTQFEEVSKRADTQELLGSRKRLVTELDLLGRVTRSVEELRTPSEPDLVSTVEVKDVAFDSVGNQTAFTQITTKNSTTAEAFSVTASLTRTNMVHNALGQVESYDETGSSSTDATYSLSRTQITYDSLGQQTGYRDLGVRSGAGEFAADRSAMAYDSLGRLVSYSETGRTQASGSYTVARSGTTYNDLGQEIGFTESLENNQGDSSRTRTQSQYNRFGLLLGYTEVTTTPRAPDEAVTTVVNNSSYDAQGRLIGFEQERSRLSSNLLERVVRTQTVYNEENFVAGYTEHHTQTGADDQGNPILIEIDLTRDQVVQNSFGQVASYRDQILSTAVGFPQTVLFENGVYDAEARLVSFKETVSHGVSGVFLSSRERALTEFDAEGRVSHTVEKSRSAAELNIENTNETTAITYDSFDRQTGFIQNSLRQSVDVNGVILQQTQLIRSAIQYNGLGQVTTYQDTLTGTGQATIQKFVDQATYDGLGRLSGYREQGNSATRGGFSQIRSQMRYNTQGELIAYQDQLQDEVEGIRAVDRQSTTYTDLGQVSAFTETVTGENGFVRTDRQNISTNAYGVVMSYTDTVVREPALDEIETIAFTAGAFDSLGRLLDFSQTKTRASGTVVETQTRSGIAYNVQGQVSGYQDAIVRQGELNGQALELNETVARSQILYTLQGNVAGYEESVQSSLSPLLRQVKLENGVYDTLGNRLTFKETTTLSGVDPSGNAIEIVEVKERLTTEIDAAGRESGNVEKTVSSLAPQFETVTTTENISYLGNGLLNSFTQTVRKTSLDQNLDFNLTVSRQSSSYNGLGELNSFVQQTTSSVSPNLTQTVERLSTTRNSFGLVTSFEETVTTQASGIVPNTLIQQTTVAQTYDTAFRIASRTTSLAQKEIDASGALIKDYGQIQTAKTDIAYDFLGNELSFVETKTDSRLPNESSRRSFSRDVNLAGETLASVDNTRRLDAQGNLLFEQEVRQTNLVYNSVGQLTSFNQEVWQSDLATLQLKQVSATARDQMSYNAGNQLLGYHETGFAQDGNFETARSTMTYNSLGQLASFHDAGSSSLSGSFSFDRQKIETNFLNLVTAYEESGENRGGAYRLEREAIQYDALNQVTDYRQRDYLVSAPDEILHTEFSKGIYDVAGRLLTFERTRSAESSQLIEKTVRAATAYDAENLVSSYQETISQTGTDENGLAVSIARDVSRTNITYNAQKEMTGYQETSSSNLSSLITTVIFSNAVYDAERRLVSFNEETQVGENSAMRARLATEYDAQNRVTRFVEKLTQSGQPDFETTLTTDAITYDSLGRQYSFNQTSVRQGLSSEGGLSLVSTLTRTATTYDTFGRVVTFAQEQTDPRAAAITQVLERRATAYNALGQIQTIQEVLYEKGRGAGDAEEGVIQETTRTFTYNEKLQTKTEQSVVSLASNLNGVFRTVSTLRENIVYDDFGNQAKLTETAVHSDYPGETSQRQFAGTYNAKNQLTGFTETVTRLDESAGVISMQTTTRSDVVYGVNNELLGYKEITEGSDILKTETVRSGLTYNALEQLTGFSEEVKNLEAATPVVIGTRVRSNMIYNARGELVSYDETSTNPEQGSSTLTRSSQTFDFRGRVVSYVEAVTVDGMTNTTTRTNTQYNERDLAVSYTETVQNSLSPTEIQTVEFSGATYDLLNRLNGYTRRKTSNESVYVEEVGRSATSYDTKGRVFGYTEQRDTLAPIAGGQPGELELVDQRTVTRTNSGYNDLGQLTSYDDTSDRTPLNNLNNNEDLSLSQDRTITLFRNGAYDGNGRLLSFDETQTRAVNGVVAEQPQVRNWTRETTFDSLGSVQENWIYTGDTIAIEGNELVWDNTQAGGDKTGYLQQSASLGETQGYTVEIALQVEEAGTNGIVLFWKGAQYGKIFRFVEGELQDVMENKTYATSTSDALHTYRFVVKGSQLQIFKDGALLATDGLGSYQFSGFQEPVQIANTDARARIASFRYYTGDGVPPNPQQIAFSEELTIQRNRVNTFDASGRLAESVEVSTSSAEPDVQTTVTTNQLSYDDKNRQTSFTQTVSRQGLSSAGGPSLLDITETQVRSGITYDSKNRLTGYHDAFANTVAPELTRTVDRSLIVYTYRDEVASYNEVLTEIYAGGNTYVTEQQVDRTYDHLSQLKTEVVYERASTELSGTVPPGGTVPNALISVSRRTKTDIVVDPLGVELHSIVREEDLTEAYLATDYNAALAQFGSIVASVNPTNPLAAHYDNYSFVSNGNFLGDADGAYINEEGSITLNFDPVAASTIVLGFYNGANQRGAAYRVEVSADGTNFETIAEQAITELVNPYSHEVNFAERSVKAIRFTVTHGINFGGGPLFYLSEIQLMTPKPSAVQQGIKAEIQNLDTLGLDAKYETSTRTTNKTNALGQIVAQTQIRNKTYEGMLIETVKVDRSEQVYNELGLLSSYTEETTTVMTTWLSFQRLDTNLTSPLPLSVNSYLYNYIGTAQDFDYNGHGHYVGLGSYAPTTWDIYQSSARTNITYNNKAQTTGYTESGISRPFGGNYSLTRSGMQYNAKGELVTFTESGTTEAAGSYNFTRDQIIYASTTAPASGTVPPGGTVPNKESIISYHEAGANPQDGPYNYIRENKAFDTRGRVTEVEESGTKNGFAYNYHRSNIKYNVNELATSWTEQGVMRGVTYDVTRHMTRYNNMGQETDHFEEGTRAGAHFFEVVQRQAYDKLGRFFKSETVSGETNYTVTYSGTRASTFYNQEGQVSGYTYYSGSTFVDVTNIQYDSNANIIGYTETTRGGATRVIFNILFDAAGRIISQQFTDSSMEELKFGNVNTQSFSYDEKTGALLEFKIENGDFTAVFDAKGNRKSFELSAQMKAFIEEEQRKAVEEAKAKARKQAAAKKKVQDNRRLISRTEVIEKGGKGKPSLTTKLSDSAIQALFKNDKVVKKLVEKYGQAKTAAMLQAAYKGKAVLALGADAIREKVSGKVLTAIAQSIKARAPNAKNASEIIAANTIRRVTEVYEVTDAKGNIHRVTEIKRIDGNGNQIERQVIDRFTFRDERGKKVKAQIVSLFNADDRLIKVGESYKQKMKKGTAVTKRTTVYDPETGDIVSQKTKQKFEKSGFFNSTAGKILGAIIVVAAIVFAPYLMPFLSPLVAAGIGAGIATFGVSLAQGNSFKDALISGALAFATTIISAQVGSFLQGFGSSGGLLSEFGKNLSQLANPALAKTGAAAFTKFLQTAAIRATGTLIADKFGSKLGAFGTAAVLTASAMLIGGFANAGADIFNFDSLINIGLQSAAQGGLAEAFKNENGLAAQALFQLSSTAVGAVDFRPVAQQFSNFVEGTGKVITALNPFTEKGLRNGATLAGAEKTGLKQPDVVRLNDEGEIKSLEYNVDVFDGKSGKVIASDPTFVQGTNGEPYVVMELEYKPNPSVGEPAPVQPTPNFWQRFGTGALDIGEGMFKGDFINQPTGLNTVGQIIGGLNPVADGRDIIANIKTMIATGGSNGKLGFTFALIGAIPLAGDAIKTVFKSTRAVDAAVNAGKIVTNPIPEDQLFARVLKPEQVKQLNAGKNPNLSDFGGADDAFITTSTAIPKGLTKSEVAHLLEIPESNIGGIIRFKLDPLDGLASPIRRNIPGFVGRGRTAGDVSEFVIPNRPVRGLTLIEDIERF